MADDGRPPYFYVFKGDVMQKKILILSHNPARDYTSDSILALELRARGHVVWLNHFLKDDGLRITIIKPDIVIIPEVRCEYSIKLAEQCKKYGIQVVVKMCEFGITEESLGSIHPDYKTAIFGRFPVNHCIDLFLAWGPKMKTMMLEHMKLESDKVVVCGAFQFDQYFLPPPPVSLRTGTKKAILFAGGFAYADRNKEFCMPEADPESKLHSMFVEKDQNNRSRWLDMISKFVGRYGNEWEIYIKPHPGERPEPYTAVLRGLPVKFMQPTTGFFAIQKADFLIHAGSTMGYEAHLKNIPSINYANNCDDAIVSSISPKCETEDSLFKTFDDINSRTTPRSTAPVEILNTLTEYYGIVDGNGNKRAAEAINNLPDNVTNIFDEWVHPKEPNYITPNVFPQIENWRCDGCKNGYYVVGEPREMVKCPFCGIANVKIMPVST